MDLSHGCAEKGIDRPLEAISLESVAYREVHPFARMPDRYEGAPPTTPMTTSVQEARPRADSWSGREDHGGDVAHK